MTESGSAPVLVYDSIECQSISPAGGEITNVDIGVASRLHLTPQQQCILRRLYLTGVQLFHSDVLNLSNTHTTVCMSYL